MCFSSASFPCIWYTLPMKKLIVVILSICIIIGLFISSSQTYEQQSIVPDLERLLPNQPFEEVLSKVQIPYWGLIISVDERGYYYFIEFLFRKSAHFFTFGAFAALIFWLLPRMRHRFVIAVFLTFLVACTDEFHQSLTGGRTATWQDVGLDMSGAFVFLLIIQLIRLIRYNFYFPKN